MHNIDNRINKKEKTLRIASELGFESYSEAVAEYHDYGLKAVDIAHLFERGVQSVKNHLEWLGLSCN